MTAGVRGALGSVLLMGGRFLWAMTPDVPASRGRLIGLGHGESSPRSRRPGLDEPDARLDAQRGELGFCLGQPVAGLAEFDLGVHDRGAQLAVGGAVVALAVRGVGELVAAGMGA